jgi:AcrR family transcriptional regulator
MRAVQRREQILAAALRVFSEYGYEKASIARICVAIGIARGTLYQYFRDKRSLFRTLVEEQSRQILQFVQPVDWTSPGCPPPEQALYARHLRIFEQVQQHGDVFRLMLREGLARNAETEDRVRRVQSEIVAAMAAEFEAGTRAGLYRCADPEFTAVYLFGGMLELIEWNLFIAETPMEPAALARKATDLQLRILLPEEDGATRGDQAEARGVST